jgi:hypothetical protein
MEGVREHLHLDKIPSVKEYVNIRRRDGACEVVWPLCFLDTNFPDAYLRSPQGLKNRTLANDNVSYVNDILSYKKDVREGTNFNIVISYMHENKVSLEAATEILVQDCNRFYEELYDSHLMNWCRGSLHWHLMAKRYK